MHPIHFTRNALALAATSLLLSACGGGGDSEPVALTPPAPQAVALSFAAVSGSQPITCASQLTNLGTTNASGGLKDLRFYIANVKLVKADGTEAALTLPANDDWNATKGADGVTLIDLEDNTGTCVGTTATNTTLRGTVPAGDYVGVKMTLGVPFAINHTDQGAGTEVTPAVINNAVHPGMAWSWAGGRKFAKLEFTNPSWSATTFNMHLGSTGCTGNNAPAGDITSCTAPNRVPVNLASFNPQTQQIALDVKALLAANDVTTNTVATAAGCMSFTGDPECAGVFGQWALDWAGGTGLPVAGATQAVFKAVAK